MMVNEGEKADFFGPGKLSVSENKNIFLRFRKSFQYHFLFCRGKMLQYMYVNISYQLKLCFYQRIYADISQDVLDYSNHEAWPTLLYSVAFMHTAIQVGTGTFNLKQLELQQSYKTKAWHGTSTSRETVKIIVMKQYS